MKRRYSRWTDTEKVILREMWPSHSKREIALKVSRHSMPSITRMAVELGISKRRKPYHVWTGAELGLLTKMWPEAPQREIERAIPKHSWAVIQHKARAIGVKRFWNPHRSKKPPKYPIIAALRARRLEMQLRMTDVAARAGYDVINFRKWETTLTTPRLHALMDWCDALGVDLTIQPRLTLDVE